MLATTPSAVSGGGGEGDTLGGMLDPTPLPFKVPEILGSLLALPGPSLGAQMTEHRVSGMCFAKHSLGAAGHLPPKDGAIVIGTPEASIVGIKPSLSLPLLSPHALSLIGVGPSEGSRAPLLTRRRSPSICWFGG